MLFDKFSFTSGNVTRLFVLIIMMSLLALGVMINSAIDTRLTTKRHAITSIAFALQERIDSYRFATWYIYENQIADATDHPINNLGKTPLRPDVYNLQNKRLKTESLIFGPHNNHTVQMAQRVSKYLDLLWGVKKSIWSMYFLDGQDNILTIISTLPLSDLYSHQKDNVINNLVNYRRAEMLQQATALDERESFSSLRHFTWQKNYYFTLRTTFNQPGHLAMVVAFDLPINDLIPVNMPLENFNIIQDGRTVSARGEIVSDKDVNHTRIAFINPNVEIIAPIPNSPLQLIYRIPFNSLILDISRSLLWPLLTNFFLLILSVCGFIWSRQQSSQPIENHSAELDSLRIINEEIISSLPLGVLVYDFSTNRTLISNKIAENLLPHLNLQKIMTMSDPLQGVLQVTVNNEVYEIRHGRSMAAPKTQFFLMRDQERELLVSKKLKLAQQILDKNHQTRQQFLRHLADYLQKPLGLLSEKLQSLYITHPEDALHGAIETSLSLRGMVDDIVLLNRLEAQDWTPNMASFNLQQLLDALTLDVLPSLKRKGLQLIVDNQLPADEMRMGDAKAIHKVLATLFHYAITTTAWGKISMMIKSPPEHPDLLVFEIIDTGSGLKVNETDNVDFPFQGKTSFDRFGEASGMAFFLCKQLCKQLGGNLEIHPRPEIGTRYHIQLNASQIERNTLEQNEKLLDGVTALIDIAVMDIRKIAVRLLENWGATCLTIDAQIPTQSYDVLITDNSNNLSPWSLFLVDDEPSFTFLNHGQIRVNYNVAGAVLDAILQLIEQRLSTDVLTQNESKSSLFTSEYFKLFIDTVPDDVKRLYNEAAEKNYHSLAQTAHRLKGVFAMLDLTPGKQLCENLEQYVKMSDDPHIESTIIQIDNYVNELQRQGNLQHE